MNWNPLLAVSRAARSIGGVLSRFGRIEATSPNRAASLGNGGTLNSDGARAIQYAYNESLLKNTVYYKQSAGGYREFIVKDIFGRDCTPETMVGGFYNPITSIVGAYQNVLRGRYGQEIRVDEKVDERDVNQRLTDASSGGSPIGRLWRMSNLDTIKHLMQEWAANLGTVGLRVTAKNDSDVLNRRVSIALDHPGKIYGFDQDDRDNVVEVELRYTAEAGTIGERFEVKVREVLSKTRFFKEINGETVLDEENTLGVCPYVILRHADGGDEFGRWSYFGSDDIVHWINWVVTNQGESVIEHAWPQWFAAAGGNAPKSFVLGRKQVAYVKMDPDTPPPIFEPLVANMDHAGAVEYTTLLLDKLYERNPELILGYIKALSGQSGETIAKLQMPAVMKILEARDNYQDALIRAMKIGLSEGIRMSLWDLGTGMGSAQATDRAYRTGMEDFAFAERPALPQSPFDEQQSALAEQARPLAKMQLAQAANGLVDHDEQLRLAGYTPKEIAEINARRATQDLIPTEGL